MVDSNHRSVWGLIFRFCGKSALFLYVLKNIFWRRRRQIESLHKTRQRWERTIKHDSCSDKNRQMGPDSWNFLCCKDNQIGKIGNCTAFVPITEDKKISSKQIIGGAQWFVRMTGQVLWVYKRTISRTFKRHPDKDHQTKTSAAVSVQKCSQHLWTLWGNRKGGGRYRPDPLKGEKEEAISLLGRCAPETAKLKTQITQADSYINQLKGDISKDFSGTLFCAVVPWNKRARFRCEWRSSFEAWPRRQRDRCWSFCGACCR